MTRFYRLMVATAAIFGVTSAARADGPASGEVTGVSVQAAPGRADVIINVRGAVEVRDFMLENPNRLVLDVVGARLKGNPVSDYDGVKRGGVLNLRFAQFKPDVVRIVLDLDRAMDYHVERVADAIRVSFGTDQSFLAWSSNDPRSTKAPAAKAAPRGVPEVQLPATRLVRAMAETEPRITVVWDRANIADVVAGFAAFSGRTIILGKDIKGEVSAEIRNQPWPQAFQAVLAAQGLSAQEMAGGIIRVDNPSALASLDSLEPLETGVVRVNYSKASDLVKSIEGSLTKNRGKVVADVGSNSLIITDTRSRIGNLTDFVKGLDIRTPQVSIKAKLVFVDRTDIEELGIKYDLGNRNQFFNRLVQRCCDPTTGKNYDPSVNVIDLGGNAVSGIGNASGVVAGSAIDLIFSTALGGFTLTSFLSAVERADLSDIQAEPVITTLDNRKADILVGEETPVRVIDASNSGAATSTVTMKETGIRLTVTPHVTSNRQVAMELHTERSSIQPLAATDLGFTFQTQRADNQLLVNDGETAVIGGLTVTAVTNTRSGIPLLSGLPIIGKLFSFSRNEENRRDLIILVTPRIIDDGIAPQ
ncbi:MAG TPA: secretin N-terminal domain-containing protein [Gemmatimonadales bacterium]|jgi:type IV pilus assembly protein PilQ|nr:secretin N-terminal domain-containing protein [Gemmatimonadales bacterium]